MCAGKGDTGGSGGEDGVSGVDEAEDVVVVAVGSLLRTTVIGVRVAVVGTEAEAEDTVAVGATTEGGSAGAFGA